MPSHRIVEEIVGYTIALLSLSYHNPALLGPVHFTAVLDPKASWFRKWMVREGGREGGREGESKD